MFIVKVILGEIFDCGEKKDSTLRIPPVKELQLASMVNVRYDSISGISKNSRIYMIYDKAYPAYNIKYTMVIFSKSLCEANDTSM